MSFNSATLLISAFLYSVFISFQIVEIFFLIPILFLSILEFKNLFKIIKKLIFLNIFILMIFIVLSWQVNFEEALNIYLRTNMIMFFNLLLFYKSNGYDIVRAFNTLKFPPIFVSSLYFTLKMIETLTEELKRLKLTLKARGFKSNSSMFTYETYGNVFGHIFVKSIQKSNALKESFILRGFSGNIYLLNSSKITLYDFILMILVLLTIFSKGIF